MKIELFLIPIAAFSEKLYFFVDNSKKFPSLQLNDSISLQRATKDILHSLFCHHNELSSWLESPRCKDRVIETYEKQCLPEKENGLAIVRAISIPDNIALEAQNSWFPVEKLLVDENLLSPDCKEFLLDCLKLIPLWVKNTSFAFELMKHVFSIQELRLLVGTLSNQEIDPGNFHRRLKKLDILQPLSSGQQRVHRWQFDWERTSYLISDGLIP